MTTGPPMAAAAASQSSSGIAVGNRGGLLLGSLNPHIESFRGTAGPGMRVSRTIYSNSRTLYTLFN